MSARQLDLFRRDNSRPVLSCASRGPLEPPPGEYASPGLVDEAFVARSVAAYLANPDARYGPFQLDAAASLREELTAITDRINAIDGVYRDRLNAWAAETRERLWMEYFTVEAILQRLTKRRETAREITGEQG
ncbi:MAG: hypothetical protein N2689_02920 [Verrucomicrobiae bacterium]|nr:hypothetical protein [Verrucomicrobiae bacterium]